MINDSNNDSFYQVFFSINQTQLFKGYIGFGIKQIDLSSLQNDKNNSICNSYHVNNNNSNADLVNKIISLESTDSSIVENRINNMTLWVRIFLSACYYIDKGLWLSDGLNVLADTNVTHTHCTSNHLTQFAGGWITVPNQIDFAQAFANASFNKNPTIYATVIIMICLYLLAVICCRYMDRLDELKCLIKPVVASTDPDANYFYELLVFTGNRHNAGTDSTVNKITYSYLIH